MRSLLVTATAIVLGLGTWVQADSPDRHKGKRPDREQMRQRMLEKYDADKDGKLDEAEKKAAHKAWKKKALEKYDANKDGKLDEEEKKVMREAREARVEQWMKQRVQSTSTKIINKLDGNDDGKLNADEVPEKYRDRFGKTDTNHDGYIDQQELQKAMLAAAEKMREEARRRMEEHRKRREAMLKKLMAGDANGDGKLNADEASERLRAKFGKVDKNHDGYIEKVELKRHFRRHHGSHSHKKKH